MKILFLGGQLDRQVLDVTVTRRSNNLVLGDEKYFPWTVGLYMAFGCGGNVRRFKVTHKITGEPLEKIKRKMKKTATTAAFYKFNQYEAVLIEEKIFVKENKIRGTYDFYIYFPAGYESDSEPVEIECVTQEPSYHRYSEVKVQNKF